MKRGAIIILCLIMVSIGWFASNVLQDREATAEKIVEYKVIPPTFMDVRNDTERADALEKILNENAKDGWKLHSFSGPLIFER